jgi:hypothetical protein
LPPQTPSDSTHLSAQLPDEIADSQREDKLAIHHVEDLVPVARKDEKVFAICNASERVKRLHHLGRIPFQKVEAAPDLL